MIPSNWKHKTLGDIFEFKNGINADKSFYGRGVKFINISEILKNNCIYEDDIPGSVDIDEKKKQHYLVKMGDVLFNRTSETFDEIGMTSVYLDKAEVVFGGFVIRARPISKDLLPDFCMYAFSSEAIRRDIIKRGQGAIRANIGQSELSKVQIIYPPLIEQRKITDILLTWDKAIQTLEKLVENSKLQKTALIQQLFSGKKRLNGFNMPWKVVKLKSVLVEAKGRNKNNAIQRVLSVTNHSVLYYQKFSFPKELLALMCLIIKLL